MNSITLVGRLKFVPQIKTSNRNYNYVNFLLEFYDGNNNEKRYEINCSCFDQTKINGLAALPQNALVCVVGRLQMYNFQKNNEWNKSYSVLAENVTLLDNLNNYQNQPTNSFNANNNSYTTTPNGINVTNNYNSTNNNSKLNVDFNAAFSDSEPMNENVVSEETMREVNNILDNQQTDHFNNDIEEDIWEEDSVDN